MRKPGAGGGVGGGPRLPADHCLELCQANYIYIYLIYIYISNIYIYINDSPRLPADHLLELGLANYIYIYNI